MIEEPQPRYTKTKYVSVSTIITLVALGMLYWVAPEEVRGVISFLFAFMG